MVTNNTKIKEIDFLTHKISSDLVKIVNCETELIGIQTGGVYLAEKLKRNLKINKEVGMLNVSFYRDDYNLNNENNIKKIANLKKNIVPSKISHDIDNKTIILVDDIIKTGRTVRAAINEIFDYGRPKKIYFVAFLDVGFRQLPFQPDVVGQKISLKRDVVIKLRKLKENKLIFEMK